MSDFNFSKPLFIQLSTEEAAIVQGGFFKAIREGQKRLLKGLKPIVKQNPSPVRPIIGPVAKPIGSITGPLVRSLTQEGFKVP